ncbi:MAG: hypothetical protein M1819_004323 [Sarea resinae]|nr:MAG: hypothetical protein M1819_004323 [Sarea resinae]
MSSIPDSELQTASARFLVAHIPPNLVRPHSAANVKFNVIARYRIAVHHASQSEDAHAIKAIASISRRFLKDMKYIFTSEMDASADECVAALEDGIAVYYSRMAKWDSYLAHVHIKISERRLSADKVPWDELHAAYQDSYARAYVHSKQLKITDENREKVAELMQTLGTSAGIDLVGLSSGETEDLAMLAMHCIMKHKDVIQCNRIAKYELSTNMDANLTESRLLNQQIEDCLPRETAAVEKEAKAQRQLEHEEHYINQVRADAQAALARADESALLMHNFQVGAAQQSLRRAIRRVRKARDHVDEVRTQYIQMMNLFDDLETDFYDLDEEAALLHARHKELAEKGPAMFLGLS